MGGDGDDTIGFALAGVGQSNLGANHLMDGGANFLFGDTFAFETYSQGFEVTVGASGSFTRIETGVQVATLINFENVIAGSGDDIITSPPSRP